jgi:hypothetical protein
MSVHVGIDVHRKRSQVAVVTGDGQVQLNKTRRMCGDDRKRHQARRPVRPVDECARARPSRRAGRSAAGLWELPGLLCGSRPAVWSPRR